MVGAPTARGGNLATESEFVEFAAVFIDADHVHFADKEPRSDVDPKKRIVAMPHPRPAHRLVLLAALCGPDVAVGDDGVGDFLPR